MNQQFRRNYDRVMLYLVGKLFSKLHMRGRYTQSDSAVGDNSTVRMPIWVYFWGHIGGPTKSRPELSEAVRISQALRVESVQDQHETCDAVLRLIFIVV